MVVKYGCFYQCLQVFVAKLLNHMMPSLTLGSIESKWVSRDKTQVGASCTYMCVFEPVSMLLLHVMEYASNTDVVQNGMCKVSWDKHACHYVEPFLDNSRMKSTLKKNMVCINITCVTCCSDHRRAETDTKSRPQVGSGLRVADQNHILLLLCMLQRGSFILPVTAKGRQNKLKSLQISHTL